MFTFDAATGRYRAESGRFIPAATVRAAIDRAADAASLQLAALSDRLMAGRIDLAAWQTRSMEIVKAAHVSAAVVAHGGRESMTASDWGFVGSRIRQEYGHLRAFSMQLATGEQPLDGRVMARSRMYGQGMRSTFTAVFARDQQGRGYTSERNILASSEHCAECSALSDRGWVRVGTLPLPGGRICRSNCRCRLAYSRVAAEAA